MSAKSMNLSWIVVSDIKKAKKFFTECLGLKVSSSAEEYGWLELMGEENKGAILGVAEANDKDPVLPGQNAVVTFTVEDIARTKKELQKKGVKMLGEVLEVPGHVKLQFFEDLDGNKFQLVESLD